MKKTVAFILVTVMILSMAGCENKDKTGEEKASEPTTLDNNQKGSTTATEIENKVELSIDKEIYEKHEKIEVSLDFNKLNQDNAIVVIVNSDTEHNKIIAYDNESAWEEYRWLADFSEIPFYLWTPEDKEGLFDVRVYDDGESGEELASVTFAVGDIALPSGTADNTPKEDNGWFSDEVLEEMKLVGFEQPDGFELLTSEELPDAMENQPYLRCLKGANHSDEYHPVIDKAVAILKSNYGELFGWVYYAEDMSNPKFESIPEGNYGDTMYVYDEGVVRSVTFTFSTMDGVDSEVLRIGLEPQAEDPRNE